MSDSTPHSDTEFGGQRHAVSTTAWRPIARVRIDLDGATNSVRVDAKKGDRVWVEAMKDGQIIGVLEAFADEGKLPHSFLEKLKVTYADIVPSPHEVVADELLPRATVVVATICQDPPRLVRTVEALLGLDYPDFEIIVVDNRPDPLRDPLPHFPGGTMVRVFEEARRGVSAARNRGIANATGEFVAFTDDDVVIEPNWLRVLGTRFIKSPEVDGIGGLVLPRELDTQPQLWFEEFFGGFSKAYSTEIFSVALLKGTDEMFPYAPGRFGAGCNMAFRRSALQRNGGFDIALGTGTPARGGEDLSMFVKQVLKGGTLAFEPRALVRHSHRRSEEEFMTQVFGYGAGLTAMYTSLIVRDPRHIINMLRRIPGGFRLLTKPRDERSPSTQSSYPRRTYAKQLLGMAYGPVAYGRSVVRTMKKS